MFSVIIPARNEEACLGRCLASLTEDPAWPESYSTSEPMWGPLGGQRLEIIVVDDGSTDRTRQIGESFAGVQVIDAGPLPLGWLGKPHACQVGADAAGGEWLLFTDADTTHRPGGVWRALEEAQERGADLLSYSPAQEVHGFAERAVMPLIFAELASAYKPREVCDPSSSAAAANGQFLLIRRSTYDRIGGHAAVVHELLEDVAIARRVKQSGGSLRFRFGGDVVSTRMYRGWAQMREGWTKNLALLFPKPGALAAKRLLEFLASTVAFLTAALAVPAGAYFMAALAALIAIPTWLNFLRRVRKAHFDWVSSLLFAPLGAPLLAYLLLRSQRLHRKGVVTWKGRQYAAREI